MKKFLIISVFIASLFLGFEGWVKNSYAQDGGTPKQSGGTNQQGGGTPQQGGGTPTQGGGTPQDPKNPFGTVISPLKYGDAAVPGSGLIILLNNLLRLVFVGAGIFAFIRFVLAGLKFMGSAGDSKGIEAAWNSIWQSLLGLIIVVSAFAIAALAGQLLFGDATAILNPKIYGPGK